MGRRTARPQVSAGDRGGTRPPHPRGARPRPPPPLLSRPPRPRPRPRAAPALGALPPPPPRRRGGWGTLPAARGLAGPRLPARRWPRRGAPQARLSGAPGSPPALVFGQPVLAAPCRGSRGGGPKPALPQPLPRAGGPGLRQGSSVPALPCPACEAWPPPGNPWRAGLVLYSSLSRGGCGSFPLLPAALLLPISMPDRSECLRVPGREGASPALPGEASQQAGAAQPFGCAGAAAPGPQRRLAAEMVWVRIALSRKRMSRAHCFTVGHSNYLVYLTVLQAPVLAKQRGAVSGGRGVGSC